MADTVVFYRFLLRGGTAANLALVNEIPLARELILETDTRRLKIGDGVKRYNALPYWEGGGSGGGLLTFDGPPSDSIGQDGEYGIWPNNGSPILYGPKDDGHWPPGFPLGGSSSQGQILPMVTGEVLDGQPVFLYTDDGELIFAEVQ